MASETIKPKVYTVTSLTEEIQNLLDESFDFVWVEGEISNFSAPVSGHYYMVLKDKKSQIRAVMFRFQARNLKFTPENGMNVIAQGKIGVYPPRGEYQLILDYLEPMGVGALALAFEQMKKKLSGEGIFDDKLKKPLPFLPKKVAVITSPTGAAIRDFLNIIHRRFANLEITVIPVRVQGDGASEEIIRALETANTTMKTDVIVLTRGGGSLEDLWAFNSEELAYAIRRSKVPVVSAIGHEIDITISDLAADFRAPTPSAAAELLVKEKEMLIHRLVELRNRLESGIKSETRHLTQVINGLARGLKDPRRRLADVWMRLDELHGRLSKGTARVVNERRAKLVSEYRALSTHSPKNLSSVMRQQLVFKRSSLLNAMKRQLSDIKMNFSNSQRSLVALSPLSVLKRGYSITRAIPGHEVIRDAGTVKEGGMVQVLLSKGELACRVEKAKPKRDPQSVSDNLQ